MSEQRVTPPIRTETPDDVISEYVETHPSYGVLHINRSHGGGHTLFGSSIEHHETICLTIHHAEKCRDLNSDHFYSKDAIIEVWMSPTQFADVITSFGQGSGTPVTIRHINGARVPLPEYRDIKQDFRSEFAQKAQNISIDLAQAVHDLKELMLKPTIPKSKLKEVLSKLESATMGVKSNMPFVLDQFHEQMEHSVTEAKGEIEAFISRKIVEKGVAAIAQGDVPVNLLLSQELHAKDDVLKRHPNAVCVPQGNGKFCIMLRSDGRYGEPFGKGESEFQAWNNALVWLLKEGIIIPKDTSNLCTICHEVFVDVANGFDTCPNCLKTRI